MSNVIRISPRTPRLVACRATNGASVALPPADDRPTLAQLELDTIRERLQVFGGRRAKTAQSLGIGVRTLQMKIKAHPEVLA
jgi:DNA-binding NtrC family response regulator